MCGRFSLSAAPNEIRRIYPRLRVSDAGRATPPALGPRYNVAPTQPVLVVANDDPERLRTMQWGLVPAWASDPAIGSRLINARVETLAEKSAYRGPLRRRRCLIFADGFYEWRKTPHGSTPVFIRMRSHEPFAFAGLWDRWRPRPHAAEEPHGGAAVREAEDARRGRDAADDVPREDAVGASTPPAGLETCTIITGPANRLLASIHGRMPEILPPEAYDAWLAPDEEPPERLLPLLEPYPDELMEMHPVSPRINSPHNDDPSLIEAVDEPGAETSADETSARPRPTRTARASSSGEPAARALELPLGM